MSLPTSEAVATLALAPGLARSSASVVFTETSVLPIESSMTWAVIWRPEKWTANLGREGVPAIFLRRRT